MAPQTYDLSLKHRSAARRPHFALAALLVTLAALVRPAGSVQRDLERDALRRADEGAFFEAVIDVMSQQFYDAVSLAVVVLHHQHREQPGPRVAVGIGPEQSARAPDPDLVRAVDALTARILDFDKDAEIARIVKEREHGRKN